MLAGIQDPRPFGERDVNALLPKRRPKLGRKLVQHGLDGCIGQVTEIGMHRFAREQGHGLAVRTDCAVVAGPSIRDFRSGKHAGKGRAASLDSALHPGARSAHSLGNVEHSALGVPTLSQTDANSKVASRSS